MAENEIRSSLLTWRSILVGAVCIALANILLEALRQVVELPFPDSVESMLATGIGVIVWFAIVLRGKR